MSTRLRTPYRHRVGMTALELAAVVTIVAVVVVTLIPVLGTARAEATKQSTGNEMTNLYIALQSYASDYSGYTPVSSAVNGGDFTPKTVGASPAGKDVWGIPPIHGGGSSPQSYMGDPPTNYPLGLGVIADEGYVSVDLLWSPVERANPSSSYARAQYFGDPYIQPWSDPASGNPGPWSPWYGGGNYWMSGSYTFRSGDWSTFTYDSNKIPMIGTGGNYNQGTMRNTSVANARPTTAGYNTKAILVENSGSSHFPLLGANVLVGDGSIVFWDSPEHAVGVYTRNYLSFYPRNPASGDTFHGGFRSLLMDAADKFR